MLADDLQQRLNAKATELEDSRRPPSLLLIMGQTLSIVLSWNINHSLIWAIVHGLCNWFYVLYYILQFSDNTPPIGGF